MSRMPRIPAVSRLVVVLVASLIAVSAAIGVPDVSAPTFSPVAQVSGTSPDTPLSVAKKCKSYSGKKGCKNTVKYSDADLRNLSDEDLESVAVLGPVLAVIALAAII